MSVSGPTGGTSGQQTSERWTSRKVCLEALRKLVYCVFRGHSESLERKLAFPAHVGVFFRSNNGLGLEILALRLQIIVLKRRCSVPRLRNMVRVSWVALRRLAGHTAVRVCSINAGLLRSSG